MEHIGDMKRKEPGKLTPDKLYKILRDIYPKEIADEKYSSLTGLDPPKEWVVEIKEYAAKE